MAFLKTITLPSGSSYDITDYRGTLGDSGTITSLPTAAASNKGNIYSVETAGTYASKAAAVGDFFVSDGTQWLLIKATDTDTTYTLSSGTDNGKITVTPSVGEAYQVAVTGLADAAYKSVTTSVTENSSDLVTSGAVWTAIDNLPEPMVFKGTVGTGGTITNVPTDGSASIGDTYKVITAGTQAGESVKVGDVLVCLTKTSNANTWSLIPAGDTDTDTWRAIKVDGTEVLGSGISTGSVDFVSGTNVTLSEESGVITITATDTDTHRTVKVDGTEALGNNTTALDLIGGTNVTLTAGTGADAGKVTIASTDTDRYVNSASFAHDTTNGNVKMTLTRAGSDTATVTANIPVVSSSSAGVAPKGADVSTQSQSTKFLREDGTWAAPSYTTNTDTVRSIKVNGTEQLGTATTTGAVDFVNGSNTTVSFNSTGSKIKVDVPNIATTSVGSASAGTAIDADDITAWTTNTPTSFSVSDETLTITAGTPASLNYTAKEIPNISVTSTTVATGFVSE